MDFGTKLVVMLVAALIVISPVSEAAAQELSKRGTERVYNVVLAYGIAREISKNCRSVFRLKGPTRRTVIKYARDIGRQEGVGSNGVKRALDSIPPARIQRDVLNYIKRRKIVIAQPQSWCDAGRAEVRANRQIGNFLHLR